MRSGTRFGISTLLTTALVAMIGCSGGGKSNSSAPTTYTLGGTITGLTGTGLVLQNDGGSSLTVSANASSFTFATPVASGSEYSVTLLSQPAGESCSVTNADGAANGNVANVSITCTQLYTIGGTITGLTEAGLTLQNNGGDTLTVGANAASFTFATPLASGAKYSVTLLTQPAGEVCTLSNGSGTATANVTNISVACMQTYTINGTVTGLTEAGLILQDNGGNNLTLGANATSFKFAPPVASGGAYLVTVLTQPASESCTVTNGSGTASADITNVSVVCVGEWTWLGGSTTVGLNSGHAGVYGTLGSPSSTNTPGGREQSITWTDASGVVWLFGGNGHDSVGTTGQLNDLWKFDPKQGTNGEWTWMSGSAKATPPVAYYDVAGQAGVFGTLGTASATNVPGGREQSTSWIDASGNLWLFGGIGVDSVGTFGDLNDLWMFDPKLGASGEWTWMGGSTTVPPVLVANSGQPGVYGTLGTAASTNIPGGRYGAVSWTDKSGNFWLFGGDGFDSTGAIGYLNDLWKYTVGTNGAQGSWTWMGGSSTVPTGNFPGDQTAQPGVYGTLGTVASTNNPGGRGAGTSWTDSSGNFWLFGGFGVDSIGTDGYLNDLWKFEPSLGEWTWMGGSSVVPSSNAGAPGVYGVQGVSASANAPGGRFSPASWTDASGNLWLSGGQGFDWTGTAGYLNDLWRYTPGTSGDVGEWTWVGGSDTVPPSPLNQNLEYGQSGVYGMLGTAAPTNVIGGRIGAASWTDSSGNLWLFGGEGDDSTGTQGYLNDLWRYQP